MCISFSSLMSSHVKGMVCNSLKGDNAINLPYTNDFFFLYRRDCVFVFVVCNFMLSLTLKITIFETCWTFFTITYHNRLLIWKKHNILF